MDTHLWSLFIGLVVVAVVVFLVRGRQRGVPRRRPKAGFTRGNRIYLLGPSGSGKTRLFLALTSPKRRAIQTVTSTKSAEGQFVDNPNTTIVDTPGHARLRPTPEQLTNVRAIVILGAMEEGASWLEYLTSMLSWAQSNNVDVFVVAKDRKPMESSISSTIDAMANSNSSIDYRVAFDDIHWLLDIDDVSQALASI